MSVSSPDPTSWFCSTVPEWRDLIKVAQEALFVLDSFEELPQPGLIFATVLTTITTFNIGFILLRRRPPMMFLSACVGVASTLVLLVSPAFAVDKTVDPQLVAQLKTAATMGDRLNLLSDDQLLYNFSANPMYSWKPGSVCNANVATWPVLATIGVTVAQLNLGPCAMLAPHLHRAHNLVVAVTGSTHTYMVQENGARLVEQILTPGMMTLFPRASVHSMYNMGCENNQLYSFLNDEDPSTLNIAQSFFMMPEEIGTQVMPFINLANGSWAATAQLIPAVGTGSQDGFEACRRTCGLAGDGS